MNNRIRRSCPSCNFSSVVKIAFGDASSAVQMPCTLCTAISRARVTVRSADNHWQSTFDLLQKRSRNHDVGELRNRMLHEYVDGYVWILLRTFGAIKDLDASRNKLVEAIDDFVVTVKAKRK